MVYRLQRAFADQWFNPGIDTLHGRVTQVTADRQLDQAGGRQATIEGFPTHTLPQVRVQIQPNLSSILPFCHSAILTP